MRGLKRDLNGGGRIGERPPAVATTTAYLRDCAFVCGIPEGRAISTLKSRRTYVVTTPPTREIVLVTSGDVFGRSSTDGMVGMQLATGEPGLRALHDWFATGGP